MSKRRRSTHIKPAPPYTFKTAILAPAMSEGFWCGVIVVLTFVGVTVCGIISGQ